ncbi:MAG TPA: UDP-N-acetylmuramoylalanyl-D-glutamyl-2,6-diaminopimelate--D-alanyl-D-alanine ligase [Ensifer sp.]|nr:UDP-N-acetylmuramoylalanyl-D-glutamyl-2,6-diaminopimelate--D-alanyl-D-alanine ligase [Ensifer sp.]
MNYLWTSDELVSAMHGRPYGSLPEGVTGISIDSRSIGKGEAFFAIKGDRVDGHDYASVASANGAALLVVSEAKLPALGRVTTPMIVVDDVLAGLERLGRAARVRSAAKVIAITGSVGKTTTKEMLRKALESSGTVHASVASFNNHWGVPLTLARMPKDVDYGVFEIGMNHAGEIRALVSMVRPDIAIITTVAGAHLGNFRSVEEIAYAKSEILEGIQADGHAILNRDIEYFPILEKVAIENRVPHIHSFGNNARADFRLAEFNGHPTSSNLWAVIGGRTIEVTIGAPGRHIAENALAVLGAVSLAGADLDRAAEALASFMPEKGRGQRHILSLGEGKGTFTLIDESYNANPASMRAAIGLLAGTPATGEGRQIAVLGDMLEMGENSPSIHGNLAQPLRQAGIKHLWLAGRDMRLLAEAMAGSADVAYRQTAEELAEYAVSHVSDGDVLVVKSSLGTGFGKITAALLSAFQPANLAGV